MIGLFGPRGQFQRPRSGLHATIVISRRDIRNFPQMRQRLTVDLFVSPKAGVGARTIKA